MKGIAFAFFTVAVICVTLGMSWGIEMAITDNHLLVPAHAHLNLVGWVTMGLFGLYYHNVPAAAEKMLAKVHFGVAVVGLVLMIPGIVLAMQEKGDTLVAIGSVITIASMLIFLYTVVTNRQTA